MYKTHPPPFSGQRYVRQRKTSREFCAAKVVLILEICKWLLIVWNSFTIFISNLPYGVGDVGTKQGELVRLLDILERLDIDH